jgi:hypothetical protein
MLLLQFQAIPVLLRKETKEMGSLETWILPGRPGLKPVE